MSVNIPFYRPFLPGWDIVSPDIMKAYTTGMLAPGVFTDRLERKIESLLPVKHAIAFSNCSDAMMCLVSWIKNKTGKNTVIVPSFTFAATWQAVDWNDMNTIVVDTDDEGLIDISILERAVEENKEDLACIFAVHISGNPAHVGDLNRIYSTYGVPVIFDAAHGFCTEVDGRFLGNNGLAEVFSIGTTKPIAAGEGGVITTNDSALAGAMYMAAMHGHKVGELDVELKSLNGRIQEVNSIIAYYGFEQIKENMAERSRMSNVYNTYFPITTNNGSVISEVRTQIVPKSGVRPSYKDYTVFIKVCDIAGELLDPFFYREEIVRLMNDVGIGTKRYYYPDISCLADVKKDDKVDKVRYNNGNGTYLSRGCVSLPFYNGLPTEYLVYIAKEFEKIVMRVFG